MLQIWFKIFFRNAKKNWLNVVVNITGLTLGLAGLLIVLLYFNDESSYNQWNPNKDDVYRIYNQSARNGIWEVATPAQGFLFKEDIPEVEETLLSDHMYRSYIVSFDDKNIFSKKVAISQSNFFNFFPFDAIEGSYDKFAESRSHIALSSTFSKQLFGTEKGVGKILRINNIDRVVACVYSIQGKSHYEPEIVLQFDEPLERTRWGNYMYNLLCKISKDSDINVVEEKMNQVIINRFHTQQVEQGGITLEEFGKKYGFQTVLSTKLADLRLTTKTKSGGPEGKGNIQLLLVLLGLSILLIIISCVNFINLSTASATQRAKEVGIKKTLGLSKKQLIIQYVFEILLQGIMALVFALILVELILPYFNQFIDKDLSILNTSILLKIVLVALATSIIVGSIPAIYLSNFKAIEVLKGNFSRSRKGIIARHIMLALQFLISGFFLIGVLVIYAQMHFMINKDLGFEKEQILAVNVYRIGDEYKKYELTKSVLSNHKNISGISTSLFVPGEGFISGTDFSYNDISFDAAVNLIDYNYIDFAKIKLIKGRNISSKFASDTIKNILINETLAKKIGVYDDPIGKKVKTGWSNNQYMEIVGMVKDYHFDGFDSEIEPMYFAHPKMYSFFMNRMLAIQFKVKPENIPQTIADIEDFWKQNVDNEYPFSYEFLDQKFAKTYDKYQKQQTMFLILSVIVIIISLLGLFALATLTIQQRLKEVAIRKTLGASVKEIIIQLVKSFLKISIIASVILIPIAYYFMQNWLDNFVYRIDMPIWPYIITPILLLLLVFVVVGVKAFNATKIDLIKYLKFE